MSKLGCIYLVDKPREPKPPEDVVGEEGRVREGSSTAKARTTSPAWRQPNQVCMKEGKLRINRTGKNSS